MATGKKKTAKKKKKNKRVMNKGGSSGKHVIQTDASLGPDE